MKDRFMNRVLLRSEFQDMSMIMEDLSHVYIFFDQADHGCAHHDFSSQRCKDHVLNIEADNACFIKHHRYSTPASANPPELTARPITHQSHPYLRKMLKAREVIIFFDDDVQFVWQ